MTFSEKFQFRSVIEQVAQIFQKADVLPHAAVTVDTGVCPVPPRSSKPASTGELVEINEMGLMRDALYARAS